MKRLGPYLLFTTACHAGPLESVIHDADQASVACKAGIALDCKNLATLAVFVKDGTDGKNRFEPNPGNAVQYLDVSCTRGSPRGCTWLAFVYLNGEGVDADPKRAAGLLEQGCNTGYALACGSLASLLIKGTAVPRDVARAKAFAEQACKGGDTSACDMEIPEQDAPHETR